MADINSIPLSVLESVLSIDDQTGRVFWRAKAFKNCIIGKEIGNVSGCGYREVRLFGVRTYVHRVVWRMRVGMLTQGCHIDHIDGDRLNNRLSNLREVTCSVNLQNQKRARRDNKSGALGVAPHPCVKGKFTAQITLNGKKRHIGVFTTPEAAHAAYIEAKRELHAGCTL